MRLAHRTILTAMTACAAVVMPGWLAGQEAPHHPHVYHHYKLVDIGTFGGPSGGISNPSSPTLNRHGALVGESDTAVTDPYSPNCFLDCYVIQTWVSQSGVLTALPALPGGASNFAASINDHGQIAGESQNGAFDPLTGWPQGEAVIWLKGEVRDLGTLGGNQSNASANNNRGQVVGAALNGTDDPFAGNVVASCVYYAPYGGCGTFAQMFLFAPAATETRAFLWTAAEGMQDLGTLGGPDSSAWIINDRGQIAGESFTGYIANASSGVPTVDPFRWDPKLNKMRDLGGLGGTFGTPLSMNRHGDVVGSSNLPGDTTSHPFLWTEAEGMQDLGTFAGARGYGDARSLNEERAVVGFTSNPDQTLLVAFLWKDKVLTNLGTIGTGTCSVANSINAQGQIVGAAIDPTGGCSEELRGLYWNEGSATPVDLNTLVVPGTTMFVTTGIIINDAGEIGCLGVDSGATDAHACLLIPCDENHADVESCDYHPVEASTVAQVVSRGVPQPQSAADKNNVSPLSLQRQFHGGSAYHDIGVGVQTRK